MATFDGLFDFPDYGLSDDQSELSSLPDSDNESTCSERTEDSSDEWYNMPSDSDDSDDDTPAPTFTLPLRTPAPTFTLPLRPTAVSSFTSTAFTMSKVVKKEHTTGARIRAIYMLNEKQPWARITVVTGISKSRVYALAAVARERG
jgi:hypothetical protein